MNFSSILIVTYGRSGSTLLQGLINSIDGCLIRGENYNFCYGLFKSYEAVFNAKNTFGSESASLEVTSPWFGAPLLDENNFLADARKLVFNQLNPEGLQVDCIGFKEIRYVDKNISIKKLYEYLNFLEKLFPNPAFIVLTRDHDQVMKSGWWQNLQDAMKVEAKLTEFEKYMSYYGKDKKNVFHVDYSDLVNQTDNLKEMFGFIGAPYDKDTVEGVLSIPHSCETKPSEPTPVFSLHIEQIEQPIIQYALMDDLPSHENFKIIHITVRGVVIINDDINPNGILIADDGEHEYPVNWKIPSPLFKTKYPKNPNAINARFKIEGLQVSSLRSTDIYFQDELANRHLLFKIFLIKED